MPPAVQFLTAFAQALSALTLYPEGHTARDQALDAVFEKLRDLLGEDPNPVYSFLGDEIVYGHIPLRELRGWEWAPRLSNIGIQRLQFDETVTREEIEAFLDDVLARLTLRAIDTSEARQMRPSGIHYGAVGIKGDEEHAGETMATATVALTLGEEAQTIRWIHQEMGGKRALRLGEAEAVVRALSVAMHGDQQVMLPLLKLRRFDEYTTTHSMNVCVLAMGLAEWLRMSPEDVRSFGVAGLLHDLGKVRVSKEILTKPGKLTPQERAEMNNHPAEGARMILTADQDLDLAAVVAYEHHIMLNGGGYPTFRFVRDCHRASKLVHVCDVYDALRTNRPYRDGWPMDQVLAYMEERSGTEFDGAMAHGFTRMMRAWEPRVVAVTEEEAIAM
ncbi:MAG: HD domain-containing protein [Gemmatimonadetes bacterium]|nr:HD domain-containing protein [Gemmatimonadota bacterium]MBI3081856.1 HD domain-containing protein [Gemmatimonadota bacterium]